MERGPVDKKKNRSEEVKAYPREEKMSWRSTGTTGVRLGGTRSMEDEWRMAGDVTKGPESHERWRSSG